MVNELEIEQLLYNTVSAQAIANGFRLGNGADQQIRSYAGSAAREIVAAPHAGSSPPEQVVDAVRAFRLLVDTMISVRKDAYRGRPDLLADSVVGEDTLAMTLGKLCPGLWPFC